MRLYIIIGAVTAMLAFIAFTYLSGEKSGGAKIENTILKKQVETNEQNRKDTQAAKRAGRDAVAAPADCLQDRWCRPD